MAGATQVSEKFTIGKTRTMYYFYPRAFARHMDTATLIQDIETRVKKLKTRNERLEKENTDLRKSVFNYLQKLEAQKKELQEAHSALQAVQVGKLTLSDPQRLRKDIDRYILMIDKCIAGIQAKL